MAARRTTLPPFRAGCILHICPYPKPSTKLKPDPIPNPKHNKTLKLSDNGHVTNNENAGRHIVGGATK